MTSQTENRAAFGAPGSARADAKKSRAIRTAHHFLVLFSLASLSTVAPAGAGAGGAIPEKWLTLAETSNFEATPTYDETMAFLRRLETILPEMKLEFYGDSASGRPMPLVILSAEKAFTPGAAQLLIDFYLSSEGQRGLAAAGKIPLRHGVKSQSRDIDHLMESGSLHVILPEGGYDRYMKIYNEYLSAR